MSEQSPRKKVAVIVGAGPAGLTAALEFLRRSDVAPIVLEGDSQVGGISKTVVYRGNRMDLGGHRFFSKSDWVMRWWQQILPVAPDAEPGATRGSLRLSYQGQWRAFTPAAAALPAADAVLLIRQRLSRIFYRRRFFDYPLRLDLKTLRNIGALETLRIGLSYSRAQLRPRRTEDSLEEFFINRFGDRLYRTFFKDYTEKVWGVSCGEISAEWGAQRIKGLSVRKALSHALTRAFRSSADTAQKGIETSLIERFLYPKLGPGQMWEEVARQVIARGGVVELRHRLVGIERDGARITAARVQDERSGSTRHIPCDFLLSSMPVGELAPMLEPEDPRILRTAQHLPYRDFVTVGLLVTRMRTATVPGGLSTPPGMPPDNWIYIQEPDVKLGRLQIFNNWSPALVARPDTIWLGLEYFCAAGDALWSMPDASLIDFASRELEKIGLIDRTDVLDGTVVRVPKAYPAYFGEYRDFGVVRSFLDRFHNLYPIGRNGMHRYNNQDHSMLAAKGAVDAALDGGRGKAEIWNINTEDEYHEEAARSDGTAGRRSAS